MRPSFPSPPPTYVGRFFADVLKLISDRLELGREAGQDVELANGERLILKSIDGARWSVEVGPDGELTTVRLP